MAFQRLRYDVADGVGTVTLNRPDKLNALDTVMLEELLAVLQQADGDDAVRVLIVTGAGRAFCAGADFSGGGGTFDRVASGRGEAAVVGTVLSGVFEPAALWPATNPLTVPDLPMWAAGSILLATAPALLVPSQRGGTP